MKQTTAYLIIDVGTGNVRVAVTGTDGTLLYLERENVIYEKDHLYPDALGFDPDGLWKQITGMTQRALKAAGGVTIKAVTATSQREGIVLIGRQGESLTGLPNHDHRGREWEGRIADKDRVYDLTGRYPGSLFSAMKLVAIRERRPELWERCATFLSISDWAQYCLTGIARYEPSQASETLLYDVEQQRWSDELCAVFDIPAALLPPLQRSGTVLGKVTAEAAAALGISAETPVVVGGADTQMAIRSTQPSVEDIVIVSGTTTPVVKIIRDYTLDGQQRTWTGRHTVSGELVLETNCGVTGLNFQRLKAIFYPNESYAVLEQEVRDIGESACMASLGSLLAGEKTPLNPAGFLLPVPLAQELTRADFAWAALWDIACCVRENFDRLCEVTPYPLDYVWGCGGGFQSRLLAEFIAGLLGKHIRLRQGYEQASVAGCVLTCNEALDLHREEELPVTEVAPRGQERYAARYERWKKARQSFRKMAD
ncbi:FGGY-family carbohydrate kinase [Compostibacter hankyongensis]|uniref:FGGY-family carbohydrate kinase n=1 Tax=Compostibacter hankyongensis TaxID=1007089 RepID=A0ABP8FUI9_9BACT